MLPSPSNCRSAFFPSYAFFSVSKTTTNILSMVVLLLLILFLCVQPRCTFDQCKASATGKHLKMLERVRCRFAVSSRIREARENRSGVWGRFRGVTCGKCGCRQLLDVFANLFPYTRFLICGSGPGRPPKPLTDFAGRFGRFRARSTPGYMPDNSPAACH